MQKNNSRLLKSEITKNKIYQSALELFEGEGYDNTTVEEIVKRAGVSKGSFFVHFPKKDHVILQYFKNLDDHLEEIAREVNELDSPTMKIIMFFVYSNTHILKVASINLIKTFYQSQIGIEENDSYLVETERPVKTWVGKWVREAQKKSIINLNYTSEEITEIILTACRGILFDWCLNNGQFDLNERTNKMLNIFFSGLKV